MNDWVTRLTETGHAALTFIVVSIIGAIGSGCWWFVRTFLTNQKRLDALEREVVNRAERHNELRAEVKEVRAEVRQGFEMLDGKLTKVVEAMLR